MVDERSRGVNIALGQSALDECVSVGRKGNEQVAINERILAGAAVLDCTRVRLLRRRNAAPESPGDAEAVLLRDGSDSAAGDSVEDLLRFTPPTPRRYVYRCQHTCGLVAQATGAGTRTVIIGQAGFTGACNVLASLAWSEAAMFKPDGAGGQPLIARRPGNRWAAEP